MLARGPRYDSIAIEEVRYVPFVEVGAACLFQVTGDLPFSECAHVIPNTRLRNAVLDRVTDRAHIIEIRSELYIAVNGHWRSDERRGTTSTITRRSDRRMGILEDQHRTRCVAKLNGLIHREAAASKIAQHETLIFIATKMVMALFQVLIEFDPTKIEDWRVWLISVLGTVVRVGAAAGIARPILGRVDVGEKMDERL